MSKILHFFHKILTFLSNNYFKVISQKDFYISAYLAGLSWLAYAYFFIIARDNLLSALFLTLGGFLGSKVFIALYQRLKEVDSGLALTMVVLGVVGTLGTMVHGGYDLANAINPPMMVSLDLPSQIDPRGLLAFGITGIAVVKAAWLMNKSKNFPKSLVYLSGLSAILLWVIYLGRLIILDPKNPILLYPILIQGFIINPLWYLWLGRIFQKSKTI